MENPNMTPNIAPSLPTMNTDVISTATADSTKDLLMIFGAIGLVLFVSGSIMFNMANYKAIQNIKRKAEQQVSSEETATTTTTTTTATV